MRSDSHASDHRVSDKRALKAVTDENDDALASKRDKLYEQAVAAAVSGETDAALEKLALLLEESPQDTGALLLKGHVFEMRYWIPQARAVYSQVLRMDPANLDAIIGLGDCDRADQNYSGALAYFQRARDQLDASVTIDSTAEAMEQVLEGQYSCLVQLGRDGDAERVLAYGQATLPTSDTIAILVKDWERRRKE